jgi:restriction system protein
MTQAGRGTVMAWSGTPQWKRRLAVHHADDDWQTREQARQAREGEKGRQHERAEAQQQAADAKTAEVEQQIKTLGEVLRSALALPPFTLEGLMAFPKTPEFDPGPLSQGLPAPDRSSFEPQRPRGLRRFLGGAIRYRRQVAAAETLFASAVSDHQQQERQRQRALIAAKGRHDHSVTKQRGRAAAHNAHISRRGAAFAARDAEAVAWFAGRVLDASRYPDGFPREYQVSYRPGSRDVVVEFELPPRDVIPSVRAYRYVQANDVIEPLPRPENEIRQRYRRLISCVTLRTLHEIFSATSPAVVQAVIFTGHVTTIDRATGQTVRPALLSVSAQRSAFAELVLAAVEPVACLARMNAVMPVDPGTLETVPPYA